ncbi:translocation/assembly module TamB domain-containing protein [Pedobacter sp. SD-b]|uniref:Translocation/assembly module TamB domain-containing protein n=1 Tax=Pedobacter segetis TaxID=2793069 RepID=A0ABS1BJT8_9SPHI|nr:translocation/assembly module TamB domain-containing protein [Pedobacter segetis]
MIGGIIFSFQFETVQTWAAKKATKYLSKEWKTTVDIKKLYLKPFSAVVLEGVYVQDLDKDTLLSAPKLNIDISYFAPFSERKIILDKITLEDTKFYLKSYKDSSTNLSFIINYFNTGNVDTTSKKPFDFLINNVNIKNLAFKYKNYRKTDTINNGAVNYDDVYITGLSAAINNLDTKNYILKAQINHLKFKEKSGFVLNDLTAATTIDSNKIVLDDLYLKTPHTMLTNYFSMKFHDYTDFDNVENKVILEGHFKNSKIYAKDIAFFAPELSNIKLQLDVTGNIKGKVNDLRAKDLMVKVGKASYLKGDFQVKGLPDIKNTFLDLNFKQVYTNKKDIEYIIERATGKKSNNIPDVVSKFGNINFVGQFTGFINDFVAYGDFKTRLGRVKSDVNMKINNQNIPSYSGKVQAIDFNLGDLIDEPSINRTSFVTNVNGRGFKINNLAEKLKADVAYFDYNDYRYENIKVDGEINKQVFNGKLLVNDKNLKLNFDGKANLNPKLPEFNFVADIQKANLHALNFTKDTIQVGAKLNTNFTGNSLENIQGDFSVQNIRLTNTVKSVVIDSVYLMAKGVANNRVLQLTSDIGDASIKGEYDLNTLPSSFKTIIKKYIPSYRGKIVTTKNQNFEFKIDLKNFDYLSSLFIPELQIPQRGAFNGKFNSAKDSVALNGYIKTLTYQGTTFNNIILDQTTNSKSLDAIISMDKVEISKGGLFVQNVIIQNTLKNDSLTFNVKLADKDAINQLDLYGLVEFGTDTLAKLSLLPSDVIIDNQVWKIQDKVRIKFEDSRTIIDNFELSSNKQLIAVNGAISKSPDDDLEVVIKDLRMASLSQLTKGFGVNLSGTMNGQAHLSAILGTPNIKSDITVDSLKYNSTDVGNLKLASVYNNENNKVDIDATIFKNNSKTMDIKGDVDIASDTNNLNLDLLLDKTELVIIEPFVKDLVSNLKGQVSSDLKVTGKFSNPQINGDLTFINSGLTVNYLNTAYTINDKVTINNSVIDVKDLDLVDIRGNKATANGTVDMSNPGNPNIQVTIDAVNFMALNTTAKENPIYYGKAYGTGKFSFMGPTDAMKINIKAKTEQGTEFTIPLNGASTVSSSDFVIYVAKDSSLNNKDRENYFNGLTMAFDLTVDEGSKANILTEVGNLTGVGNAQLNLKITSLGDFEMKGDYIINEGQFDFTANNVINKTFDISKGGTIRWTGDPTDAEINLNAVYSTRAAIAPLYAAAGRTLPDESRNVRVLAEAEMILKGSLLNPKITFGLDFPNNSGYKTELQGYLDDKDNEAQQVINLVVRNSFNGNSSAGIGIDNQTLIGSGLELGFSKLNNIVSQSLGLKNLDFNIRSLNEFGIGYNIFNNRIKFTGSFINNTYDNNYFNNNLFNSSFKDVSIDAQLTYDIKKDGSFVGKVFQRPANRDFFNLNGDVNIAGAGLVYVQEYDTFKEFISKAFGRKRKDKSDEDDTEQRNKTMKSPIINPKKEEE